MHAFKPTFDFAAYRVAAADLTEQADNIVTITVKAALIRDPSTTVVLDFLEGHNGRTAESIRLRAFLRSLRMTDIEDADQTIGRVFALANGGATADDFASLEYASACLRCDRDAYQRAIVYTAEYAAEERLGVAG